MKTPAIAAVDHSRLPARHSALPVADACRSIPVDELLCTLRPLKRFATAIDAGLSPLLCEPLRLLTRSAKFHLVAVEIERELNIIEYLPILVVDDNADRCLSKPIRQSELQEAIDTLDGIRVPSSQTRGQIMVKGLLQICGGDELFARELAASFLATAPQCVTGIAEAIRASDSVRLVADSHGLKGISRTIGAEKLANCSALIEDSARCNDLALAKSIFPSLESEWHSVRVVLEQLTASEVNP